MGVFKLFSDSESRPPNPNPHNFIICFSHYSMKLNYTVMLVKYPDCTTFKGYKILVFDGDMGDAENIVCLDPHFLENKRLVLRIVPSWEGMRLLNKIVGNYAESRIQYCLVKEDILNDTNNQ